MACCECPRCGWMGNSTVCPVCLGQCNFDEEHDIEEVEFIDDELNDDY